MNPNPSSIQLAIVNDNLLMIKLLESFFNQQSEIKMLWGCTSNTTATKKLSLPHSLPEVLLIAWNGKTTDSAKAIHWIRKHYPKVRVIVISPQDQPTPIGHLFRIGVSAFLSKDIAPPELLRIIQIVAQNGHYFLPTQLELIRNQVGINVPKQKDKLDLKISQREKEVLSLLCKQYTAQEVAEKLFITKRTVEGHKNRLLARFDLKNTVSSLGDAGEGINKQSIRRKANSVSLIRSVVSTTIISIRSGNLLDLRLTNSKFNK